MTPVYLDTDLQVYNQDPPAASAQHLGIPVLLSQAPHSGQVRSSVPKIQPTLQPLQPLRYIHSHSWALAPVKHIHLEHLHFHFAPPTQISSCCLRAKKKNTKVSVAHHNLRLRLFLFFFSSFFSTPPPLHNTDIKIQRITLQDAINNVTLCHPPLPQSSV